MKGLKKILLLIVVIVVLVPSLGAFAAQPEKADEPNSDFPTGTSTTSEEEVKEVSVVGGATGEKTKTEEEAKTEAEAKTATETKTETEEKPATETKTETPTTTSGAMSSSTVVKYSTMQSSIKKHSATNKDVKSWLLIPSTNMNFPIITPKDNFYYEKRTWDGTNYPNNNYKNYKQTATYTDYRVQFGQGWNRSSRNIVIYGHNWTNLRVPYAIGNHPQHTLFAQLPSYTSIDFAKKNPHIYFSTESMEGVWRVFAVAYVENDATVFGYNTPNPSSDAFANTLSELRKRSLLNFDVDVNTNDSIITLDTCIRQYSNVGSAQRFLVVARLIRPGESEKDAIAVTKNNSVKNPSFVKS